MAISFKKWLNHLELSQQALPIASDYAKETQKLDIFWKEIIKWYDSIVDRYYKLSYSYGQNLKNILQEFNHAIQDIYFGETDAEKVKALETFLIYYKFANKEDVYNNQRVKKMTDRILSNLDIFVNTVSKPLQEIKSELRLESDANAIAVSSDYAKETGKLDIFWESIKDWLINIENKYLTYIGNFHELRPIIQLINNLVSKLQLKHTDKSEYLKNFITSYKHLIINVKASARILQGERNTEYFKKYNMYYPWADHVEKMDNEIQNFIDITTKYLQEIKTELRLS